MAVRQWLPVDVKERLKAGKSLQIVDVREPSEYAWGHIPGAKLIPLGQLPERYKEINTNAECVIVCASGNRSGVACQYLERAGYSNVYNLMGGMYRWDGDVE